MVGLSNSIGIDITGRKLSGSVVNSFTIRVNTTLGNANNTVNLSVININSDVDWGDGTVENKNLSGTQTISHTYTSGGIYNIKIPNAIEGFSSTSGDILKITFIDFGNNYGLNSTSQEGAFNGLSNCTSLGNGIGMFNNVTNFETFFRNTPITNFPNINTSSATTFRLAFTHSNLQSFPANVFDNCPSTNFQFAWLRNAIDVTGVDNILVSINQARLNGVHVGSTNRIDINNGTSATPSATGKTATDALRANGITVNLNGY